MVTLEWREVTDMTRVEATDLICWLEGDDNNSVPGSAEGVMLEGSNERWAKPDALWGFERDCLHQLMYLNA